MLTTLKIRLRRILIYELNKQYMKRIYICFITIYLLYSIYTLRQYDSMQKREDMPHCRSNIAYPHPSNVLKYHIHILSNHVPHRSQVKITRQ